jgi:hypothetical protein
MRLIYYAHPKETYGTYLEDLMKEVVEKHLGETYYIKNLPSLQRAVDESVYEQFKNLFTKMRNATEQFKKEKIPESYAKDIAHEFMGILKSNVCVSVKNILLNPSTFSQIFIREKRGDLVIFKEVGEDFKGKSFPHFCYGIIDYCDFIVAHGYVIDNHTKRVFKELLKEVEKYSSRYEISEYCKQLLKVLNRSKGNVWSPGTFNEIEYALKIGKKVYCLQYENLVEIFNMDSLPDKEAKITFDEYGLRLYSLIWQPMAESVYRVLTGAINLSGLL